MNLSGPWPTGLYFKDFSYNTWSSSKIQLLKIVLFTARRCKLMRWISKKQPKKTPTKTQCTKSVLDIMFFEALSFSLKTNHFSYTKLGILFCPIWRQAWVGSWKTDYVVWHDYMTWRRLLLSFSVVVFCLFCFCCCCCSIFFYIYFLMVLSKIIKQVTPFSTSSRNVSNTKKNLHSWNCITLKLYKTGW